MYSCCVVCCVLCVVCCVLCVVCCVLCVVCCVLCVVCCVLCVVCCVLCVVCCVVFYFVLNVAKPWEVARAWYDFIIIIFFQKIYIIVLVSFSCFLLYFILFVWPDVSNAANLERS